MPGQARHDELVGGTPSVIIRERQRNRLGDP